MRLQKSPATSGSHPTGPNADTPASSRTPRRTRRLWFVLAVIGVGLVPLGARLLWKPDPFLEVHAALDRRDFATANDLLAKRLSEHPDDAEAQLLAARTARRGGDLARAFDLLRLYREKNEATEAYTLESDLLRVQTGNMTDADRLFAAYSTRPESPDTPFVMEAYLEGKLKVLAPRADTKGDPTTVEPTALANLRRAADLWLQLRPGRADQVQGRVWLARVRIFANDHPGGVAALREAIALGPDHFDARFQLALSLAQQSPEEAWQQLSYLHTRHPENNYVSYGLATTCRMLGRLKEARELLEGLLNGPTEISALVELSHIDMDEGRVTDAERQLRKALEMAPNSPETNIAMSRCQQLAGRPAEAEKYRKRFEELQAERNKHATPKS